MTINLKTLVSGIALLATTTSFAETTSVEIALNHVQEKFGTQSLKLTDTRQSILGEHFYFQNEVDGIAVEGNEYVLSINANGEIYNSNDSVEVIDEDSNNKMNKVNLITEDAALDIAWNDLRVHGELIDLPTVKRIFLSKNNQTKLVLVTQINVSAPYGYWEFKIDAVTGEILSKRNTSITRMKMEWNKDFSAYKGKIASRTSLTNSLKSNTFLKELKRADKFVSGEGIAFDPNPVVTLNNGNLRDNSRSGEFEAAYVTVVMPELTLESNKYILKGPYVEIADFESPSTRPSTTTDGKWDAKRGDNAFNDVMTYYHLDNSQRYIQSLGYTGDRAFLNFAVKVDSDGLNGADNSHFIPSSNKLAFGHGCVDDNEDTDVILHEYGHAIQSNIIPNWRGGDTGAMGEGFGDYWAASFSSSRPGGMEFHPEWVFKWDGHNNCWGGRNLDKTNIMYSHSKRYGAHSRVTGGVSDELWSTPLFQAFLELRALGHERSEMDKIVLEAHFGLKSSAKMRDLAKQVVAAAKGLFPNGPHADIYTAKFKAQKILK